MPIYEYRCEKCGMEFEELVRGNESLHCPSCGSEDLGRKLSAPAAPHVSRVRDCPIREAGGCACSGDCGHRR